MKVLLIGGNGFIGSHLLDGLLEEGYIVRVFDIGHEKFRDPNKYVDYRISNLSNIPDLYEAMLDVDVVFHLASSSVPSTSNVDIVGDIQGNLISSINILNMAIRLKIKKFVYFSSGGAVYGIPQVVPISEDHPRNPISSYGILKDTVEQYVQLYYRQFGLDYLILRPSNPYGPRQGHFVAQGVISTFLRKTLSGEDLQVFGDGNGRKDYIYIKDLVDIVLALLINDESGVYNVGSGIGTSINDIIMNINDVTGKNQTVNYTTLKDYDVTNFVLDMSKVSKALGLSVNSTDIKDGINETWSWIQSQYTK